MGNDHAIGRLNGHIAVSFLFFALACGGWGALAYSAHSSTQIDEGLREQIR